MADIEIKEQKQAKRRDSLLKLAQKTIDMRKLIPK